MWKCEENFKKIQNVVNDFFEQNPNDNFPGMILIFERPENEDEEPKKAAVSPLPGGLPRELITGLVQDIVDNMRVNEHVAYVAVVREAWGLFQERPDKDKNKAYELKLPNMECRVSQHPDKKSIILIEVYEKDNIRVSCSVINEEEDNMKFVGHFEDLRVPEAFLRGRDLADIPGSSVVRH